MVWSPDLLLLDEPDNHLDLEGKERVEKLVRGYAGAVVIVSHDRYLLDQTVDRIAELERGQITVWPGTYSNYAVNKQLAMLRQEQLYRAQQKRIIQIEAAIKRFEEAAAFTQDERHARQARHRHKMLERMDKIERPQEGESHAAGAGRLARQQQGARRAARREVVRGRRDRRSARGAWTGVSFQVWHGERVGLVGPNGAGKSVLFRCILGAAHLEFDEFGASSRPLVEQPDGGVIKLGPSVKIGYYAQQHETLHPDWTLVQEIRDAKPMYETDAVAFLQRFLFDYYAAQKQVRHLSGGERSRLQLAKLMLSDVNFLHAGRADEQPGHPVGRGAGGRAGGVQRDRAGDLARPLLPGPHRGPGRGAGRRSGTGDCRRLLGLHGAVALLATQLPGPRADLPELDAHPELAFEPVRLLLPGQTLFLIV